VQSEKKFNDSTKGHGPWLLLAASDGLGKRVPLSEFRMTSRTAAGVIGIKMNPGVSLVNVHVVEEESEEQESGDEAASECLVASSSGMMSRIALKDINVYSRTAKGVRITRLMDSDMLSSITPCKYRHFSG
jgi:DNA gyrase subunit A